MITRTLLNVQEEVLSVYFTDVMTSYVVLYSNRYETFRQQYWNGLKKRYVHCTERARGSEIGKRHFSNTN